MFGTEISRIVPVFLNYFTTVVGTLFLLKIVGGVIFILANVSLLRDASDRIIIVTSCATLVASEVSRINRAIITSNRFTNPAEKFRGFEASVFV